MFRKSIFAASAFALLLTLATLSAAAHVENRNRPASESLTECTVIFQVYALMAKTQDKPEEMIGYFNKAAARFRDAALQAAGKEGAADPKAHVTGTYNDLLPKWQKKYAAITGEDVTAMAEETKNIMEWVSHCGTLGREAGILPLPEEEAPVE